MADLIFDQPLPRDNDLRFGHQEPLVEIEAELIIGEAPDYVSILLAEVIDCQMDAVIIDTVDIVLAEIIDCQMDAVDPPHVVDIRAQYDNNVSRGPRAILHSKWRLARRREQSLKLSGRRSAPLPKWSRMPWAGARPASVSLDLAHGLPDQQPTWGSFPWQGARPVSQQAGLSNSIPSPNPGWCSFPWRGAAPIQTEINLSNRMPVPQTTWRDLPWCSAVPKMALIDIAAGDGQATSIWRDLPWQDGRLVIGPGVWVPIVPPEPPAPPRGRVDLVFKCDLLPCNVFMDFAIPCCGQKERPIIPILDTYFMLNEIYLLRERDMRPIACLDAAARYDPGTWTWGVDVTVPVHEIDHIGRHERLRLIINGRHYVWIKETRGRQRQFGQFQAVTFGGRSQHAELDVEPTSGIITNPINAQQIAAEALEDTGYTLVWNLPDWPVPAGAYQWEGLTRIARVAAVVDSVGGVLYGDPAEKKLIAYSAWPTPPWRWDEATPRELPSHVCEVLNIEESENDSFDAVHVMGELIGVDTLVRRYGYAGENLAPDVIHPLMTHTSATQERGIAELAKGGITSRVTLSLPLLNEVAPFELSELIQATGTESWRGLVRGFGIAATRIGEAIVVNQTVEVEEK